MSLMNVAMDLISKGRKVALIDFDLEAPGLNTFGICANNRQTPGVVEFVHDYLATNVSPDILRYFEPCDEEGRLWLMPAGAMDDSYSSRLAEINWRDLYARKDGFFLFEDLKAQIQRDIAPDYLLIDSRTGHTDVGGICTRQLPNSVVFLFFPNEQNLHGLKKVSDLVDKENRSRNPINQIAKHFVTSNVPDLDDENRILADRLVQFSRELGYSQLHTIHRYNSLSLLNQEIFTSTRPNTRLAEEYRQLTKVIIQENPEDKEGAANFLNILIKERSFKSLSPSVISERIEKISEKHSTDSALMILISQYKEQLGEYDSAVRYIDSAISSGYKEPGAYLRKAKLSLVSGNTALASEALTAFLGQDTFKFNDLNLAINLISRAQPDMLYEVFKSSAFYSLEPEDLKGIIELHFLNDEYRRDLVENAVLTALEKNKNRWSLEQFNQVSRLLPLLYISQGEFRKAIEALESARANRGFTRPDLFNLAMARWGRDGQPNNALFKTFLDDVKGVDLQAENANFKQCLSIAYWVTGKTDFAIEAATLAQQQARDSAALSFSCWTYLYRRPRDFSADINDMLKMYRGAKVHPAIFVKRDQDLFT